MHFSNEFNIPVKFCVYKTADLLDVVPCEGGVVFLDPGNNRNWNPAPGEYNTSFDVRVFKPQFIDQLLGRVAGVHRRGLVKITPQGQVVLDNTLLYHNIEISYPAMVEDVRSLDELVRHVSTAAERRLKVRAVGGGYSFSDIAHTDGCFLYTHNLNKVLSLDSDVLKAGTNTENLRKVEAGITVETLNKALWAEGKALINQGGYDQQTIFGALCTGTHGSGITLGSIASTVRSMHILTCDTNRAIRQVQVEPSDGITDPAAHKARYPKIELIQDDDVFYSCTVCFGAMGVTYAVVMDVRDSYWLKEDRIKQPWSTTKKQLLDGLVRNTKYRHVEVLINPYKETSVLTFREEVKATAPSGQRNFIQTELAKVALLVHMIQQMANSNPSGVPDLLESALEGTTDSGVIDRCYEILNIGPANEMPVVSSEMAIDATDIGKVVVAVEEIISTFKNRASSDDRYITSPFSLRFVKADKGLLSMQYGRDTCMIEVPMLSKTYGLDETLRRFRAVLEQKHDGRPHWGQVLEIDASAVQKMYPKFDVFKRTYQQLNASGVFSNEMTIRSGLDG